MHKYLIFFCLVKKVKLSNSLNAAHRLTDEVVKLNSPNKPNAGVVKKKGGEGRCQLLKLPLRGQNQKFHPERGYVSSGKRKS